MSTSQGQRRRQWWQDTPEIDEDKVGITFVDLLFALVVGEILAPLQHWWKIPATGWTHLTVAMVLTMGSWIGYHTSANRPKYAIKFVNYPFIQFVLDVSMVIAYWLTAATTPLPSSSGLAPTAGATSESLLVAISFILYILWDRVSKIMQERPNYPSLQPKPYDHGRRVITVLFALGSVGVVALAWWVQEGWGDPRTWVIGIDCALVALLVLYRAAKELWKLWKKASDNRANREEVVPLPLQGDEPSSSLDVFGRLDALEAVVSERLEGVENALRERQQD